MKFFADNWQWLLPLALLLATAAVLAWKKSRSKPWEQNVFVSTGKHKSRFNVHEGDIIMWLGCYLKIDEVTKKAGHLLYIGSEYHSDGREWLRNVTRSPQDTSYEIFTTKVKLPVKAR